MTRKEDVDDMPMWQNHEQRITKLEILTFDLEKEFTEIKELISKGNADQTEKLDIIDNRLMDEFFIKRKATHDTKMKIYAKVAGGFIGGSGVLYALYDLFL